MSKLNLEELQHAVDDQLEAWIEERSTRGNRCNYFDELDDLGLLLVGQLRLLERRIQGIEASLDALLRVS